MAKGHAAREAAFAKREMLRKVAISIDLLKNKQGEAMTMDANWFLLLATLQSYHDALNTVSGSIDNIPMFGQVYPTLAHLLHVTDRTLSNAFNKWRTAFEKDQPTPESMSDLLDEISERKRRGPPPQQYRTTLVTSEHVALIRKYIDGRLEKGQMTYSKTVQQMLRDCETPLDVSKDVLRRLLRAMGYVYEKRKPIKYTPMQREKRLRRIREFLLKYSAAVRDPNLVVCFMDESYVHNHHAFDRGYFKGDDSASRASRRGGKGKRLIIVHCITKDGVLHVPNGPSCEWIFPANSGKKDYHTNMDGDKFMEWINNNFIPTFEAMYPGKRSRPGQRTVPPRARQDIRERQRAQQEGDAAEDERAGNDSAVLLAVGVCTSCAC